MIAGDFNSHDVGRELANGGFAWPTREHVGPTARWRFGGLSYDHVFARGLSVTAAGVEADNRHASDHQPVWALLARDDASASGPIGALAQRTEIARRLRA